MPDTERCLPLSALTAAELTCGYATGEIDPVDVAEETMERAHLAQVRLSAVAAFAEPGSVLDGARAARERWREGRSLGPLDGVPLSIKESVPMAGFPRRHGSAAHEVLRPTTSVPIVHRLAEAGALVFATTAMPDLALLGSGMSSAYGIVRNPWDPSTTTGGSSSGAASLVAAGVGAVAVGTDAGGSVRMPAAHQGLYAIKPTQGRIAYTPNSVRSAGPLARTVDDMEALLTVIGQEDPSDLSCLPGRYEPRTEPYDLAGRRIGVIRQMGPGLRAGAEEVAELERQAAVLERLGAVLVDVHEPVISEAELEAMKVFFQVRLLVELHTVPSSRRSVVIPEVYEQLEEGYGLSALAHGQALETVDSARNRIYGLMSDHDLLLTPATATTSFPADSPFPPAARHTYDQMPFAAWFNQTGQPAGVVPTGTTSSGTPVCVQVAGRRFADADVVGVMRLLEAENGRLDYPVIEAEVTGA
ncbi:amidase [Nocardioides bruguierae]|uniref:amidase n=1 Tax=Nocardioides bruguierae TaxID=2945102 RepID=UPI00202226E5|nr:amidase family protein [Nocardioides bruguierae]MCL8025325.1 amidase family protein [Nocardioides bruguierae]